MKLPYHSKAFIPPEKINDYLLSSTHEDGRHKAALFSRLGFNQTNTGFLEESLLRIVRTSDIYSFRDIFDKTTGEYLGKSYAVVGVIIGTNGSRKVKTVWKVLKNKRKPSLVTVSPM